MSKILVIDDEELICWFLQKELKKEGHEVSVAMTGEDGLEIFKDEDFCCVITDLKLPGISGFDVIKKIKNINPEIKVIATTAWQWEEAENKEFKNSIDGFLEKPVNISNLKEILKNPC